MLWGKYNKKIYIIKIKLIIFTFIDFIINFITIDCLLLQRISSLSKF